MPSPSTASGAVNNPFENRYRTLLATPDAIVIIDLAGTILDANASFIDEFPVAGSGLIGKDINELLASHPHGKDAAADQEKRVQEVLTKREPIWFLDIQADNISRSTFNPVFSPDGEIIEFIIVKQDITPQQKSEARYHDIRSLLNFTLEKCHIGAWVTDLNTDIKVQTSEHARIFGYDSVIGKWDIDHLLMHVIPEDRPMVQQVTDDIMIRRKSDWDIEYRIRRADGKIRWVQDLGGCEYDQNGKITRILGVKRDITEAREKEKKFREQQQQLNFTLEHCHIGAWTQDLQNGTISTTNEQARIFGYAKQPDWNVKFYLRHIIPEDRARNGQLIRELVANPHDWINEFRIRRVDGAIRWMQNIGGVEFDENGKALRLMGLVRDITDMKELEAEREQLQKQLQHSQKLELLGQLAGGIAHDFNNVLAAIQGNAELLLNDISQTTESCNRLTSIVTAVNRSAEMVRQLLAFARKQQAHPINIQLDSELDEMRLMLHQLTKEKITLLRRLHCPDTFINLDPSTLVQIITNLFVNARDAIADTEGTITLDTSIIDADACDELKRLSCGTAGKYVRIAVSDTGSGIDPQTLPHIFEPFFTTKGIGKGTGLGLSMVYGLVKQNDGHIICRTDVGKGTTFEIFFPIVPNSRGAVDHQTAQERSRTTGKTNVLVVEDEKDIAKIIRLILEKKGYNVFMANNAEDGIKIAHAQKATISLTISDIVLPGMNGVQMSKELLKQYPDMKFLFMSGYSADILDQYGKFSDDTNFISKPFNITHFINQVQTALKKRA